MSSPPATPWPKGGPLSLAEAQQLDTCLLPALERHHLRLLAHGLRTVQAIAGVRKGPIPSRACLEGWVLRQPHAAADPAFARVFLEQLLGLGSQLESVAMSQGCSPLELRLEQLMAWAGARADERLGSAGCDHQAFTSPLP